jgi:hypothetical protein
MYGPLELIVLPLADVALAVSDGIVDALDLAFFMNRWLGGVE